MRVGIVYWRFLKFDGSGRFIGGIETYISLLVSALKKNYELEIFQCAEFDFIKDYEEVNVVGVKTPSLKIGSRYNLDIVVDNCVRKFNPEKIIFATEEWCKRVNGVESIGIQHGIYWDKPINYLTNKTLLTRAPFEGVKRHLLRRRAIQNMRSIDRMVCVDYNYVNWIRTFCTLKENQLTIIPNAIVSGIGKRQLFSEDKIRILFARRFEDFRGVNLTMDLIRDLEEFKDILHFTFAGEGTLREKLEQFSKDRPNVDVTSYDSRDVFDFLSRFDLALIPSLGSEGTSFSLLEAMSVGCVVLASNVGGMTNIVIDKFNGFLIPPDCESFSRKIREIISRKEEMNDISINAIRTTELGFNLMDWRAHWIKMLC